MGGRGQRNKEAGGSSSSRHLPAAAAAAAGLAVVTEGWAGVCVYRGVGVVREEEPPPTDLVKGHHLLDPLTY